MTNRFVDSVQGVGGAGNGTSWANAYLTLAAALTAGAAGDTFWVGDDHAETQASAMTLTSPGTVGNPCFIYCVDHTKASPGTNDLKTTATITTTGNSALNINGTLYCYGITFNVGNSSGTASLQLKSAGGTNNWQTYEACVFALLGTGTSSVIGLSSASFGGDDNNFLWINTQVRFSSTSQTISPRSASLLWRNTGSAILGSLPTTLIGGFNGGNFIVFEGVDVSALGSGKTLIGAILGSNIFLKDCKFGASVTVVGTPTAPGQNVYVIRSDSAATNYRHEKYSYDGTETTETSITRVGGASDGTTAQSRKIATTANSKWVQPYQALPLQEWNDVTGTNRMVTVYGTWNSASLPNNDDIWIEAEYLGSASSPLGSVVSSTKANNLASGAVLSSDASTWNGGGSGAGWSPFKMTVTLSSPQPAQKGVLQVTVKAAKASSTFYIDPLINLS